MYDCTVEYLADYPEYIEACVAWDYGYWGIQETSKPLCLADLVVAYRNGAQKSSMPLTLIAIEKKLGVPVGMASLWDNDGEEWSELTPWIAAVFVHNRYRGRGYAKALVCRAEEEARRLGTETIYLKSGAAAAMYRPMGYVEIDMLPNDKYSDSTKYLLKKKL